MIRISKKTTAVTTAAFAVAGGGLAFAFFTGGTATGSTSTDPATQLTVASPVYVSGHLTPGNQETRKSVISNPTASTVALNGFSVEIVEASGAPWTSRTDPSKPTCTAQDFDVWPDDDLPDSVPANGNVDGVFHLSLRSQTWNQDNCLGLDTVPLRVTVS